MTGRVCTYIHREGGDFFKGRDQGASRPNAINGRTHLPHIGRGWTRIPVFLSDSVTKREKKSSIFCDFFLSDD